METNRDDFTRRPFSYYVEKFQRRLFRRLVEYQVLKDHLEEDLVTIGPGTRGLLALGEEIMDDFAVKDHIEKACLTGMKAEFELFFTIYCTLVLDHHVQLIETGGTVDPKFLQVLQKTMTQAKFAEAFVGSGLRDARRISVEQLVPKMGLPNLEKTLENCGWAVVPSELDVPVDDAFTEELDPLIGSPWKQIVMAFQVRHAIEHNFSKVSRKGGFYHHAVQRGALAGSTWKRWWSAPPAQPAIAADIGLGTAPLVGDRILVDMTDIRGTAAAMSWVAKRMLEHWGRRELPGGAT